MSNVVAGPTANVVILNTSLLQSNGVYTVTVNGVRDAMSAQSVPANSQVSVGSELVLWLKADAGVTADASGFVSAWADQSGNGNHATQPADGFKPLLVSNVLTENPPCVSTGPMIPFPALLPPHCC